MSQKVIVCRCEDVTLDDLAHAVALGYAHVEEAKRYTGFGTGPCQGKECLVPCALALLRLADEAGLPSLPSAPFTARPPLQPIALGTLAAAGTGEEDAP